MAGNAFSTTKKLAQAKAREYTIVDKFPFGYRNREDVTNLPPSVLIVGSQNVITNVSDRVQIRQGYSVDGAVSSVAAPVLSSFDWLTKINGERHLRAGGLTSAGNDGKLQYRYVDAAGAVTWRDLITALTTVAYNFTTFWNTTESLRECLFVNGTSNIFKWNGALTTLLSATNNTSIHIDGNSASLTAYTNSTGTAPIVSGNNSSVGTSLDAYLEFTGNPTDAQTLILNINATPITIHFVSVIGVTTGNVLIGATAALTAANLLGLLQSPGTTNATQVALSGANQTIVGYSTYTTTTGTLTTNGTSNWADLGFYVTGNKEVVINGTTYTYTTGEYSTTLVGLSPDPSAEAVNSVVHQSVVTTANSSMTAIPATFPNGLIRTLNNQVFVGALTSSALYISNVNSFTDYSSSTPRQTGEGGVLILDSQLTGLEPQENFMYVTAGQDLWYNVNFQVQTSTVGVTYEQVNALPLKTGRQQGAFSQAFLSHMKNDIIVLTNEPTVDTFGRVEGVLTTPQQTNVSDPIKLDMDSYDFTDGSIFYWRYFILLAVPKEGVVRLFNLNTKSWEAPQTLPISRFYIVEGELYGHSYNTFESYKLFDGYADRTYTDFNGFPIPATWKFSYQNYGSRFSFKKATKSYVEGYINANTNLTFQITYELDGCQTVKTFTLSGSDQQFVCISGAEGSDGKESLGKLKLGGDSAQSIQGLPPKFRWFPTFNPQDFFECSMSFSVLGTSQRMELLAFGLAVSGSNEIPVQKMD